MEENGVGLSDKERQEIVDRMLKREQTRMDNAGQLKFLFALAVLSFLLYPVALLWEMGQPKPVPMPPKHPTRKTHPEWVQYEQCLLDAKRSYWRDPKDCKAPTNVPPYLPE